MSVKLKKVLFILLAAAVLLVGCGGESAVLDKPYETSSAISMSSDAGSISSNTASHTDSSVASSSLTSIGSSEDEASSVNSSTNSSSNISDAPKTAEELLDTMTLDEKIAQLFIVEPEALLKTSWGTTAYSGQKFQYPVGGVIFFAGNIKTPQQTTDFIKALQSASKIPMFITVDEEGGKVARIGSNKDMGTTAFPPMYEIKTEQAAYNVGKTIGKDIKQFGFNLDLAPVADVTNPSNVSFMSGRSFGTDPDEVSKLLTSCINGFNDSGMLTTLKHFPGKGYSSADSHYSYSELNKTLEEWRETEKKPFKAGIEAGADFIMAGHYAMPKITGNNIPASLSPELIKMLREELEYDGLIMTDSLQMKAITNDYADSEVGVKVLEAGIDIILMPNNLSAAFDGIKNAVNSGRLTEERINQSVLKILKLKYSSGIIE